ncbi:hypothetical protein [Micromonospora sp. WMMD980]|uniref:hypothetical protein n=1 Tax=Micromonospora sp. WMMD980 TaxID=3016088 RepID=UPI00241806F6|nr:hypothetical protein [Micromonospora sp. WMMD980]MDG4801727.1 hypothetical protein [Micromonospora sp. WMMD980]
MSATGALTEAQYEALAAPQGADGLSGHPDDPAPVRVSGSQAIIPAGLKGNLRGFPWASGSVDTSHTIDLSGPARVDLIVLRLDRAAGYVVGTAVRKGTADTAPAPLTGTGPNDVYEIPLAEVRVSGGALTLLRLRAWYIGEDGQILCKSSTRPPHAPGRRIRETDTGRTYESTGTVWAAVLDDSGTVGVSVASGYTFLENNLRRVGRQCIASVKVMRKGAAMPAGSTVKVGVIPDGFRPSFPVNGTALYWSGQATVGLRATPDGSFYVVTPAGLGVNPDRSVDGSLTWFTD